MAESKAASSSVIPGMQQDLVPELLSHHFFS